MEETVFYVLGIGVVIAALALSFAGLRWEKFPGSRGLMTGVVAGLAVLVLATAAFAWMQAETEQDHRQAELAAEEAAPAEEQQEPDAEGAEDIGEPVPVSSPASGEVRFEQDKLEAAAGTVTLAYENPSEVPHNVAIDDDSGQIAQGETGTAGTYPVTADLQSGSYSFYCSITGHREAGMEGTLTVK